jgi:hypothetical protein
MRKLILKFAVVVAMGGAAIATEPRRLAAETPRSCAQCGTVNLCTADFCTFACGGIGSGANCSWPSVCGDFPMAWIDCGDVS